MPILDRARFLTEHRFTDADIEKCGVRWEELEAIVEHHRSCSDQLAATGDYVADRLRQLEEVHSLKLRVKDPSHLAAKIVRKLMVCPELPCTLASYRTAITDLVGIRALHLFKDEWKAINDFVRSTWELAEEPTAYVRDGDPVPVTSAFTQAGCRVDKHPFGYRSVHYLIKSQPAKEQHLVELQVRTLFEEAWSEIDHRIRYPRASDDPYLAEFLTIFNRLAGSADEMGTFIKALSAHLLSQAASLASAKKASDAREQELKEAIAKLKISARERASLQEQIDKLRESRSSVIPFGFAGTDILSPMVYHDASFLPIQSSLVFSAKPLRVCKSCGKTYEYDATAITYDPLSCPACMKRGITVR